MCIRDSLRLRSGGLLSGAHRRASVDARSRRAPALDLSAEAPFDCAQGGSFDCAHRRLRADALRSGCLRFLCALPRTRRFWSPLPLKAVRNSGELLRLRFSKTRPPFSCGSILSGERRPRRSVSRPITRRAQSKDAPMALFHGWQWWRRVWRYAPARPAARPPAMRSPGNGCSSARWQ